MTTIGIINGKEGLSKQTRPWLTILGCKVGKGGKREKTLDGDIITRTGREFRGGERRSRKDESRRIRECGGESEEGKQAIDVRGQIHTQKTNRPLSHPHSI